MFERAIERYRSINRPGPSEESVSFRVAVLVAVIISVYSAARYAEVGWVLGTLVIAGVIAGSVYSYYTRKRSNIIPKLILSVLLLFIFALFWTELSGSLHDLRYPLVRLFLWLQVLHSFDLPMRRDLDFSLLSATILMAFAGSLSTSSNFVYLLVPFSLVGLTALYLGHHSSLRSRSDVLVRGKPSSRRKAVLIAGFALLPLTLALFMFLPRLPGFSAYYHPVSFMEKFSGSFEGLVKNPGYEYMLDRFPSEPLPFNPDAYHGFSKYLDLRVRGVPNDELVMKVRSDSPSYWRALAFDRFLGNGWENTDEELEEISSEDLPLTIAYPGEPPRYATSDVTQTFFIEKGLPNTVFAAYVPRHVFFPTRVLKVDSMMSVIAPVTLDRGLIYTVISELSDASPQELRSAGELYPPGVVEKYTQVPEMSEEVAKLAREIAGDRDDNYDRVVALSEYLRTNYEYDLDCPPQENEENTVEFFLFEERRGYCEHFATTLAVMCRTMGIPARLAAGFDTGDFNPLTGYYEVSARDAHAWVEVYFPSFGWIAFDPTPGWSDPGALSSGSGTWSGLSLLQYIGRALSNVFPESWGRALSSAFRSVAGGIKTLAVSVAKGWRIALPAFLSALVLIFGYVVFRRRRKSRRPREAGAPGPRRRAEELWERLARSLSERGLSRRPCQTPMEYAGEVDLELGSAEVSRIAGLFYLLRFGKTEPGPEELDTLEVMIDKLERSLANP